MIKNTINSLLKTISLKKQYINKLKSKTIDLTKIKQQKKITHLFQNTKLDKNYFVKYIIDITFLKNNTLIHVMDFSGHLRFFMTAGQLQYKKKEKRVRQLIIKNFVKIILLKLHFLKNQPIVVNLKNSGSSKFWLLKLLKKKFFVKVVRIFRVYPHNGCRKKKIKRKKIRTKSKK